MWKQSVWLRLLLNVIPFFGDTGTRKSREIYSPARACSNEARCNGNVTKCALLIHSKRGGGLNGKRKLVTEVDDEHLYVSPLFMNRSQK